MQNKASFLIVALSAFLIAACQGPTPYAPEPAPLAMALGSPGEAIPIPPAEPSSAPARAPRQLKPELVARKLATQLNLAPNAQILDLSSSPGHIATAFTALLPQSNTTSAPITGRPFPAGSADLIFFANSLHSLDEPIARLEHLKRALTPTGAIALLEYKDGALPIGPPAPQKTTRARRHELFTAAGLTLQASLATHLWQDLEIWSRARITR